MELRAGYKQTEVGVIPEDWDICDLSDAVEFLDGQRRPVKSSDRVKMRGIYPYYGASGVVDYVNDYIFDEDLILLGEDGENILSRNLPLAFRVSGKIWVNNHAHVMRPKDIFNIGYLTEFLESRDYALLNSGTAQPKLNKQTCLKIKVSRPTKTEQTAIANALSDTDALIQSLTRLITKKRQIKQGAMQTLLNPYENGRLKAGWEVKKLGDISKIGRGRVISRKEINLAVEGKYPVYSSQTTNDGIMGYIDTYDLDGEYITWTTDGENAGKVFCRSGKFNCTNVCGAIKLFEGDIVFVSLLLGTITPKHVSRNLANPKLMNDPVKKIDLPLPHIDQQARIATILSDMDADIAALEAKLAKTQQIKQGMMQNLLTGRIRLVKEKEKIRESA